jgi:hypothetical protein
MESSSQVKLTQPAQLSSSKRSKTEELLRHLPRPVVCVPEVHIHETLVLVAYDGSVQAARTLQAFAESGLGTGREIQIASLGNDAQVHAELAQDFLNAHMLSPRLLIEESAAQPAKRLLEVAQRIKAGLIVLGCYGQA